MLRCRKLLFVIVVFFFSNCFAANYGRWGAVDRYTSSTVLTDAFNNIRRLALFDGLTFNDSTIVANFSSLNPIKGDVDLAGGRLRLERDLIFDDITNIVSDGRIYGRTEPHSVTFPGTFNEFNYSYTFRDIGIFLNSDLTLNDAFTFRNSCTLNGQGKRLILGDNATIYIEPGDTLLLENIILEGVSGDKINCLANNANLSIQDSVFVLSGDFTFDQGSLDFYNDVVIQGTADAAFIYESSERATIHSYSKLLIDRNITFSYAPSVALKDRLSFEDASSTLYLNGCTLFSSNVGMELTNGRLVIEDKVTIQNNATVQSQALVIKEPIEVDVLSGAIFDTVGGMVDYQ